MGIKRFLREGLLRVWVTGIDHSGNDVRLSMGTILDDHSIAIPVQMMSRLGYYTADMNMGDNISGTRLPGRGLYLYNGVSGDRLRNNVVRTVLASAARTATTASADQTNYNHKGIFVVFDVTAVPGTDTVQLKLQAYDGASGKYVDLLTGTAESAVGTYLYGLYPGIGDKNTIFDNYEEIMLPRTWRVQIVHSSTTSFTYSVGVAYVL